AGLPCLGDEFPEVVAAVVADGGVEAAVEQLEGGDENRHPAAVGEPRVDIAEGLAVVVDVLEDVQHDDPVPLAVPAERSEVALHDGDVGPVRQPVTQDADGAPARLAGGERAERGYVLRKGAVA